MIAKIAQAFVEPFDHWQEVLRQDKVRFGRV